MSPARSVRIDELIRQGIASGKKFTAQDMVEIQHDLTDVFARRMLPNVVKLAETAKIDLPSGEK